MAQILQLPHTIPLSTTGGLMAGAKLYTYTSGTSAPQSVYSDYALATPHANPVVADSNGVFPVMYWGNTNRYRLTLKTSADVTMAGYPVDDCGPDTPGGLGTPYLTGNNTFTGLNMIQGTEPRLKIDETDAGTDKRLWDIDASAGVLKLRTRTDADGSGIDIMTVTRGSGTAVASIDFPKGVSTTSTGTLTGCTTSPTVTVHLSRMGSVVAAYCTGLEATSNATTCTITGGVPAGYRPAASQSFPIVLRDNTAYETGLLQIDTAGVIYLFRYGAVNFTTSGTKGIPYGMSLAWSIE